MAIYPSPASALAASTGSGEVVYTEIDLTDGSWTLLDPDGLAQNAAYSVDTNIVTMNALAVGSATYSWSSTTSQRGPRWYKNIEVNGLPVVSNQTFWFLTQIEYVTPVAGFGASMICALAVDPTSTLSTTIDGSGGGMRCALAGSPDHGGWANNIFNTTTCASAINVSQTGGRRSSGSVTTGFDAGGSSINCTARADNNVLTDAVNLSLMVGVGARSVADTWASGVDLRFKLSYSLFRLG